MRIRLFVSLALSISVAAGAAPGKLRLTVPADLSAPTVTPVVATGLTPGERAKIVVVQHRDDGHSYVATADYAADRQGWIDTGRIAPLSGTYAGREPLGLFWSGVARAVSAGDPPVGEVAVSVEVEGQVVATAGLHQRPDPAVYAISRDTPFPGAVWARPADEAAHAVVIVLGGSEGGSGTARVLAPLFAARGYATLGLPYYDPGYDPDDRVPGLPRSFTDIPVNRLDAVRAWLSRQPGVDADRIGVWGASKGAEFALIAASRYPWIKAVVAVVPSDLVWEGWGGSGPATASFALDGRPLAFEPYAGMAAELAKAAQGEAMDLRRVHVAGRAAHPERVAAARIPIERFRGRLLLVAGGRDQVWPSAEMAANIVTARARAGEATGLVSEPLANHFLGGPGTAPVAPLLTAGSDAAAIAHARAAGWAATFALFGDGLARRVDATYKNDDQRNKAEHHRLSR